MAYFEARYQLIIRNVESFAEHISPPFSYFSLIVIALFYFFTSFMFSLWLAKTVLAKWISPTYIEEENKKKIISVASTVEELERQIELQTNFIETLQKIIKGKSNNGSSAIPAPPLEAGKMEQTAALETLSPQDISLQHQKPQEHFALLMSPIRGMITDPFDKKAGHYGVDIVAREKDPIQSIAPGVVVFADWSVDSGWVIVVQHHNNLVSIYKHCAILFKKIGNLIGAGDVIALIGNSGELSKGAHLHFELWYEGIPLNPEDFFNF